MQESSLFADSSGHYVVLNSLVLNVFAVVLHKRKILISSLLKRRTAFLCARGIVMTQISQIVQAYQNFQKND